MWVLAVDVVDGHAGGSEFGRVGSPFVPKRIEVARKNHSLWQTRRMCHGERKERFLAQDLRHLRP